MALPVSQFDHSKDDPRNSIGIVSAKDNCGVIVGAIVRIISDKLSGNQSESVIYTGLKP